METLKIILFVSPNFIMFIALVIALIYFKTYRNEFKLLTLYLTLSCLTQVVSFIYWCNGTNNYPILHIYTPLESIALILFFSVILKGFIPKTILILLLFFLPIFSVIDSLMLESIYISNTYTRSIEALVMIILCVTWYIKIVGEPGEERARSTGVNYIVAGFLIYFAGSLLLFSYSSYIQEMALTASRNLWTFHTFLIAQLSILIITGLWKVRAL